MTALGPFIIVEPVSRLSMPQLTPTGAVDAVERQLRRVRRRKNLFELQRALYWSIAATGAAAALLLPVALLARVEVFAAVAWSTLVVLAVLGVRLAGSTVRGRLSRTDTIVWVEREGALGGRMRTLLELGPRPALATAFFHPLLVAAVRATLAAWAPRRLVPQRVPRGPLMAALAALVVLAAVRWAALAPPTVPDAGFGGLRSADSRHHAGDLATTAENRVPDAPSTSGAPWSDTEQRRSAAGRADSRLTRLAGALQESVRGQVWGQAWERVRAALASTATGASAAPADDAARDRKSVV